MRIIFFLLVIIFITKPVICQVPSKKEMQAQMLEAVNEINKQIADLEKQIADAKKNNEDESTIKDLEDQVAILSKQVEMMKGVNKTVSGISEKTFQQAGEEEAIVAEKDVVRINMLPKKLLTEEELVLLIKNVHAQIEKTIPVAERTEALKVYNEIKAEHRSVVVTANAATGYWMLGHWEKALFIMGKVCIDEITNADNLNNYAAFLISTGGEQAALPILMYLDNKYPDNSTIKNNIGQAWFGLGDLENAKKLLDETTILYPGHSMANATLSNVYQAEGDNEKAIAFLKASLKETYDPEKEQQLLKLGYKITYFDMPSFDYPMKKDPLGFLPLLDTWKPNIIQHSLADVEGFVGLQAYLNGISYFNQELNDENDVLDKEIRERNERLSIDSSYRREFLDPYNCPAYLQAARSLQLLTFDVAPGTTPLITQLLLPFYKTPQVKGEIPLSIGMILKDCQEIWDKEVLKPIAEISREFTESVGGDCRAQEIAIDAYLRKRAEIYQRGVDLIKTEFVQKSKRLDAWITLSLYSMKDDPPKTDDDLTKALISHLKKKIFRNRFKNKMYKELTEAIDFANAVSRFQRRICPGAQDDPEPGTIFVKGKNVRILECEFQKTFITPLRYQFDLMCNTFIEKTDGTLEKRKPDINKGSVQNSIGTNQSPEPLQTPGGPNDLFYEQEEQPNPPLGPLTAENKVISQCYIEYNKWGNFVGFKFQLNEDGTELKDPASNESGIDSRWSWNAIASPKKGFLNKLVIK